MKTLKKAKDMVSQLLFFLAFIAKIDKWYYGILLIKALNDTVTTILSIYIPTLLIDAVSSLYNWKRTLTLCLCISLLKLLLVLISKRLEGAYGVRKELLNQGFNLALAEKAADLEYEKLESAEMLDLKERAEYPIAKFVAVDMILNAIIKLLTAALSFAGVFVILARFNLLYGLAILVLSLVPVFFNKKYAQVMVKITNEIIPLNRRYSYYCNVPTWTDYQKEFRVYKLNVLMESKIKEYSGYLSKWVNTSNIERNKVQNKQAVIAGITKLGAYLFAASRLLAKSAAARISLGEFVLIINSTENLSEIVKDLFQAFWDIYQTLGYLKPFYEFMHIEAIQRTGDLEAEPLQNLEFKHISFRYPSSDKEVLRDINFTIGANEGIVFVGKNGAGKSTIIKLICLLYETYEGVILWNGRDVKEYNRDSLLAQIGIIFQDYKMFPFTIRENITVGNREDMDDESIYQILGKMGLYKKITELPDKLDTYLDKSFCDEAVNLSIGQEQKLAIARAVSKKGSLMMFDEPTSALDPLAESEIYEQYLENSKDKISIWVSHRMSVCNKASRVIVINDGEIHGVGTHAHLLHSDELYRELYQTQEKHYMS